MRVPLNYFKFLNKAFHVLVPTIPSALKLQSLWNAFTAVTVPPPKTPSAP